DAAVVVNSDSPTLPTDLLVRTAAALLAPGDRAVLGPADDGGYYLLGMKAAHAALFTDIAWSTGSVAAATRERAGSIGLDLMELPIWYDVDDQASLLRLCHELAGDGPASSVQPYEAPATTAALRRMRLRFPPMRAAAE